MNLNFLRDRKLLKNVAPRSPATKEKSFDRPHTAHFTGKRHLRWPFTWGLPPVLSSSTFPRWADGRIGNRARPPVQTNYRVGTSELPRSRGAPNRGPRVYVCEHVLVRYYTARMCMFAWANLRRKRCAAVLHLMLSKDWRFWIQIAVTVFQNNKCLKFGSNKTYFVCVQRNHLVARALADNVQSIFVACFYSSIKAIILPFARLSSLFPNPSPA